MTEVLGLPIPGWEDGDLRQTANANFGLGNDAGLPESIRFLVGVARAIRKRHQEAGMGSEQTPAIFFLRPTGVANVSEEMRKQPMLDNGQTQLGGSFWFVGPPVCRALGLPVPDWSEDGKIFDKAINDLDLGDVPAVFFDPRGKRPTLRHYPAGLARADEVVVSALTGGMDIDRVIEIIEDETQAHLDGPAGGANLWKDPKKHWPSDRAEKKIQFALKVAMHHAFPTAVIREEQPQMAGRLDLEVEEPLLEEGEFIRHAILELKVLRSFRSTGSKVSPKEVREIVKEGVGQAISYRKERKAKSAALCCFDMRVKSAREKCFSGVTAKAEREKLELQVWPIYASAAERRAANR